METIRTTLLTGSELELLRNKAEMFDEAVAASRLFVEYDAANDEDGLQMMLNYNNALGAAKAILTRAQQLTGSK